MNPDLPLPTEPAPTLLPLGEFGELVFDDEPLEPLLNGTNPVPPTPANVLEIWRQGLDRSGQSVRALLAVLINRPDSASDAVNLELAESLLRDVIQGEAGVSEAELASCHCALGRLLHLRQAWDEAQVRYRQALEIQERTLGWEHAATVVTSKHLIHVLEAAGQKDQAARFSNVARARQLIGKSDGTSLWNVREIALQMFRLGQYDEAEAIYRRLLERRFALASTYCHLARIFLMTDREIEAREVVQSAWRLREEATAYAVVRTQFMRLLLAILNHEDWKSILRQFHGALSQPETHMDWTMQPVLDHLKPRLGEEIHTLLTAIIQAIGNRSEIKALDQNPIWKEVCGGGQGPKPAAGTAAKGQGEPDKFSFDPVVSF